MSNGNLQRKQVTESPSDDTYLEYNDLGTQALLLSAYLEERKKWEENKSLVDSQIKSVLDQARQITDRFKKYSRLKLKFYNFFGIKTKEEKELLVLKTTLESLNKEMVLLAGRPPDPSVYELAAIGNLFRAR